MHQRQNVDLKGWRQRNEIRATEMHFPRRYSDPSHLWNVSSGTTKGGRHRQPSREYMEDTPAETARSKGGRHTIRKRVCCPIIHGVPDINCPRRVRRPDVCLRDTKEHIVRAQPTTA